MWLHERSNLMGDSGIQCQLIEGIQSDYLDPVSCVVMSPFCQVLNAKRAKHNCVASADNRLVDFEIRPAMQHGEKLPRYGCMGEKSRHKSHKRQLLRCLASR